MRVVDFLRRLATRDVEGGSLNLARSTLRLNRVRIDIQELDQFSEFAQISTEFINEDHLVTVIAFPSFVNGWSVDRQAMLLPDIPGLAKASFAPTPMDFNSTMDNWTLWLIVFEPQLSHPDRLDTRGLLYDSNHRVCLLQDLLDILNINASALLLPLVTINGQLRVMLPTIVVVLQTILEFPMNAWVEQPPVSFATRSQEFSAVQGSHKVKILRMR